MHILLGALIGAVCGAVAAVAVAYVLRRPITTRMVLAGALGGMVGGAITAATLGAGGVAAATAARTATAYFAGGVGGGGASKAYENYLDEKPLEDGVLGSSAIGGVSGLASFGGATVAQPVLRRVAPAFADLWFGAAPDTPVPAPPETDGLAEKLDEISDGVR